jgi:hypothetical protein
MGRVIPRAVRFADRNDREDFPVLPLGQDPGHHEMLSRLRDHSLVDHVSPRSAWKRKRLRRCAILRQIVFGFRCCSLASFSIIDRHSATSQRHPPGFRLAIVEVRRPAAITRAAISPRLSDAIAQMQARSEVTSTVCKLGSIAYTRPSRTTIANREETIMPQSSVHQEHTVDDAKLPACPAESQSTSFTTAHLVDGWDAEPILEYGWAEKERSLGANILR